MGARVERFVERARRYCSFIEEAARFPVVERLRRAAMLLAELYAAGLNLPDVDPEEGQPGKRGASIPEWPGFGDHEPYREVFDPYEREDPVSVRLSDDLLDVYREVRSGLMLYDHQQAQQAIWEWRVGLETHWGDHATDALRALQRALARAIDELPRASV